MLPKITTESVAAECISMTPTRIVEAICDHRRIASEALAKVDAEGTVVRTLKGDVIAHPAIKIHADAAKAEVALLKEWGRNPVSIPKP